MKYVILMSLSIITSLSYAQTHKRYVHKNQLYPGLSFSYLPTWLLDEYRGNTPATVFILGLTGHQEIWKESDLQFGVGQGKIYGSEVYDHVGIILPIKLQKFFVPERKGFNLAIGMLFNFCKTCPEGFNGAFTNEISYLFAGRTLSISAGLQILEGALFDQVAVHVGGQIEVVYRPDKAANKL